MTEPPRATSPAPLSPACVKSLLVLALATSSASDASPVEGRTANAQRALSAIGARIGEPCEDLFAMVIDPSRALDDLRHLKALAKQLAAKAEDRDERDAATLLYHAAVATAFGRYREQISEEPLARRLTAWRRLARLFAGEELGAIFEKAVISAPR